MLRASHRVPIQLCRRLLFSTTPTPTLPLDPILNVPQLQKDLTDLAPSMAKSLTTVGYWTNLPTHINTPPLIPSTIVRTIREQCIALRNEGRFEQSVSESIDDTGVVTTFEKEGVWAYEPDGADYDTAPDLLTYMSIVIGMLPPLLNNAVNLHNAVQVAANDDRRTLSLSNEAFNAKLAVTSPGSTYPLHVDNTLGITGSTNDDTRKLTCILYLNPDYEPDHGGELRLVLGDEHSHLDLTPEGGRMVLFWSDEIPHEVLPCAPHQSKDDITTRYDRYALTVWIPDTDPRNIQPKGSRFESLRLAAFK
mmetsp:Transcript_30890/g.37624  ORF Transcript_30890/g.37624 Transcript_30890/m.37624 type:complete len:307 (+) Transcript_30890:71-991(+)